MIGIKPTAKCTKTLLYRYPGTYDYRLFDVKSGKYLGKINMDKREKELYIKWLKICDGEQRKGYGTFLLDFAKKMSEQMGFNGRLELLASILPGSLNTPPHIFYRKYGFTSNNRKMLSKIDRCIKNNKQLTSEDPQIHMYYEPKKSKSNIITLFGNFIKRVS